MRSYSISKASSSAIPLSCTSGTTSNMSQTDPYYNAGKWLPSDQATLNRWIKKHLDKVHSTRSTTTLYPVVAELKKLIDTDPEVNMFFYQMFNQVPNFPPFLDDPMGKPQVQDYDEMLFMINEILTTAPEYSDKGLVGFPINAILNWSMATPGGFAAFLNDKVNLKFKNVLNHWGVYLKSAESTYVLNDKDGWFSPEALAALNGASGGNFADDFVCDPNKPHYGYTSWDDFFTRLFRDGIRPVASPDDPNVIANACESAPYALQKNVQLRSTFWMKGQEYSLQYMLNNDPRAELFVGGTVYQAFLSALSYHRWHSPVDGTIVKTEIVDGSYYSGILLQFDPAGPDKSQGYITQVAARALIFIKADNPAIGLMCFVAVGMSEVSSNEITVFEGQHVKKGQELGMFHFGGSTHCLIFRPEVNLRFVVPESWLRIAGADESKNIKLSSKIAEVI